jgi:hypothetical protein
VVGAVGFVLMLPFSIGWYGPEHPLSFVLGALVVVLAARARAEPASAGAP